MTVGSPAGKPEIDGQAGSISRAVRDSLRAANDFCLWLQDTTIIPNDAYLTAMNYSQAEVNVLRAGFVDLQNLYKVSHGLQATGASDFFANAKKLWGTSV